MKSLIPLAAIVVAAIGTESLVPVSRTATVRATHSRRNTGCIVTEPIPRTDSTSIPPSFGGWGLPASSSNDFDEPPSSDQIASPLRRVSSHLRKKTKPTVFAFATAASLFAFFPHQNEGRSLLRPPAAHAAPSKEVAKARRALEKASAKRAKSARLNARKAEKSQRRADRIQTKSEKKLARSGRGGKSVPVLKEDNWAEAAASSTGDDDVAEGDEVEAVTTEEELASEDEEVAPAAVEVSKKKKRPVVKKQKAGVDKLKEKITPVNGAIAVAGAGGAYYFASGGSKQDQYRNIMGEEYDDDGDEDDDDEEY